VLYDHFYEEQTHVIYELTLLVTYIFTRIFGIVCRISQQTSSLCRKTSLQAIFQVQLSKLKHHHVKIERGVKACVRHQLYPSFVTVIIVASQVWPRTRHKEGPIKLGRTGNE
jgi:hypothetical protein